MIYFMIYFMILIYDFNIIVKLFEIYFSPNKYF